MNKVLAIIGGAILFAVFFAAFIAYFITSNPPGTYIWVDGFGRVLSESPWFMRFIFGQDRLWAGWGWFAADMVIFWGGIAAGFSLINYAIKDK